MLRIAPLVLLVLSGCVGSLEQAPTDNGYDDESNAATPADESVDASVSGNTPEGAPQNSGTEPTSTSGTSAENPAAAPSPASLDAGMMPVDAGTSPPPPPAINPNASTPPAPSPTPDAGTPPPPPAPVDPIAASLERGAGIYPSSCAGCHGSDGQGGRTGVPVKAANTLSKLTALISGRMPKGNASACSGTCPEDVARYILATF